MNANSCILCGNIIPEGRMICPACERDSLLFDVSKIKNCRKSRRKDRSDSDYEEKHIDKKGGATMAFKYLFRGKSAHNKRWLEGDLMYIEVSQCTVSFICPHSYPTCEVIPETIRFYTGIKDKNGTKVFVGDVVRITTVDTKEDRFFEVGFGEYLYDEDRHFGVFFRGKTGTAPLPQIDGHTDLLEIMGNIYDNSELLS